MVATRIYEVTSKGKDWAYGKGSSANSLSGSGHESPGLGNSNVSLPSRESSVSPFGASSSLSSSSAKAARTDKGVTPSFLDYANDSIHQAAESTYASIANVISSLYTGGDIGAAPKTTSAFSYARRLSSSIHSNNGSDPGDDMGTSFRSNRRPSLSRNAKINYDLGMLFKNPYNSVRGRTHHHTQPSSMSAVRSLLTIVPAQMNQEVYDDSVAGIQMPALPEQTPTTQSEQETAQAFFASPASLPAESNNNTMGREGTSTLPSNDTMSQRSMKRKRGPRLVSQSETASQIAEGTIRALRDIALDEAVELQAALRYWTVRWERPILSWLEAGPVVWTSPEGYNHQLIGKKVSQIQAVLARRCAAIGELQQHLLRAGWQRGVAQWGVLGQGGQWAAVAGFDGSIAEQNDPRSSFYNDQYPLRRRMSSEIADDSHAAFKENCGLLETEEDDEDEDNIAEPIPPPIPRPLEQSYKMKRQESMANVHVKKKAGGGLFVDDPAFLAEWSVEAIWLVRRQLERASLNTVVLPYLGNWLDDDLVPGQEDGTLILEKTNTVRRPLWAGERSHGKMDLAGSDGSVGSAEGRPGLDITNLPLMVEEVSELLDVMEDVMEIQRMRRLEVFKPPGWLRRRWYIVSALCPSAAYFIYRMFYKGYAKDAIRFVAVRISDFLRERVKEPVTAIFNELLKGRENFSDSDARKEAIESLKKMLRSWLDDTFPLMPEAQRAELSEAMDVTLLEQQKVESMKTFFEINNVIRMSFIEMQYMKKELLNALDAIDQMMSANDINMNIAAITPVAMLVYLQTRFFKFLYYVLLRLGKSRAETYESFRNTLTDIERLLVMRDNPPAPASAPRTHQRRASRRNSYQSSVQERETTPSVLGADDLGMLMLLVHECRSILWRDRRRFTIEETRSVSEDLAELAGERGVVSVQQQLQIVRRMFRIYPFLQLRKR